jgi:NitT/TauT family transport system substrate-binding protein
MVRKFTAISVILILAVGISSSAFTWYFTRPPPPKQFDKVIVALPWIPSGSYSPFYVGLDKGYYEDEGIIITIQRGFGSSDTCVKVDTGRVDFGYVAFDAFIKLRGEGSTVTAIGLNTERFGGAILLRKELGVTEPKDLEGLKLGTTAGSSGFAIWPGFAQLTGLDTEKVELSMHTPASQNQLIVSGQVDGLITSSMGGVIIESLGQPLDYMMFWDYGIQLYGYGLITSEEMIEENPDLVKRFVKATHESFKYAGENLEEAIDIIIKYNPELQKDLEIARYSHVRDIMGMLPGVFPFDPEIVQSSVNIASDIMGGFSTTVIAEDIFTNEFTEGLS